MQTRFTLELEGLEGLKDVLEDLAPRVATNILRGVVYDVATTLRDDMRQRVPVRSVTRVERDRGVRPGTLRRSIAAKRSRMRRDIIGAEVFTREAGWYWHFVEYGTRHSQEQPFVRPAIQAMTAQMPAIMETKFETRLARTIEREVRRAAQRHQAKG